MGMAKIGNWFRRQDIAYLGIQQRENSVYMIMVAEKEGEDYDPNTAVGGVYGKHS